MLTLTLIFPHRGCFWYMVSWSHAGNKEEKASIFNSTNSTVHRRTSSKQHCSLVLLTRQWAFPVAALREMAIVSCSPRLAWLHYQLRAGGLGIKVDLINQLRNRGVAVDFSAVMTHEHWDQQYRTRDDSAAGHFVSNCSHNPTICAGSVNSTLPATPQANESGSLHLVRTVQQNA